MAEPRLVKTTALAEILGVSEDRVQAWAANGDIPTFRLPGGNLRFDVDAVLERLRVDAEPTIGDPTKEVAA